MSVQTDKLLRHLAQLSIALEDYQSLREADFDDLAHDSAVEALRHVRAMRLVLDRVEYGLPVEVTA